MNRRRTLLTLCLTALLVALAVGGTAAQTSPSYNLEWHTLAGGGGRVTSSHYAVHGIVGQMLGAAVPSSASYRVEGGLWGSGGQTAAWQIYLPLVTRTTP